VLKRPEREADHSPPSSAEVKNAWSYTSTTKIRLHGVVLGQSTGTTLLSLVYPVPIYVVPSPWLTNSMVQDIL
jgi:hypothetical protein